MWYRVNMAATHSTLHVFCELFDMFESFNSKVILNKTEKFRQQNTILLECVFF